MWLFISIVVGGCNPTQVTHNPITVKITADNQTVGVQIPTGSTVQEALDAAKITISEIDKVEPALYAILSDGEDVRIIRCKN